VGTYAGRDAAGGAGGIAASGRAMMLSRLILLFAAYLVFVWYVWRETPSA